MSDHADTIRRDIIGAVAELERYASDESATQSWLTKSEAVALLAERQQLQEAKERVDEELRRCGLSRQQLQEDKDGLSAICSRWEREYVAVKDQRQQAIDALREVVKSALATDDAQRIAEAALAKLGEKP